MESAKHLDEALLAELEEIMEEDFGMLLETYLADALIKLDSMESAVSERDEQKLRESSHSLKGSSSNVGAVLLSDLLSDVEQMAIRNNIDDAREILPGIASEYQQVKALLENRISH